MKRKAPRARPRVHKPRGGARVQVRVAEIEALQRQLKQRTAALTPRGRWNPDPEEMQRSVAKLVLTLVEFLRKLMERQAIRRMEERTLTAEEIERVGTALMRLEETLKDLAGRFGLEAEDLNLDLGPLKLI